MRVAWPWDLHILGVERVNKRLLHSMLPVGNPIARARLYQRALGRAGERSYAKVAAQFDVTRQEVCQYVTLMRMPRAAVLAVERETSPKRLRVLSLRCLLRVARLGTRPAQWKAFVKLFKSRPMRRNDPAT
jgi:hypothetical protein